MYGKRGQNQAGRGRAGPGGAGTGLGCYWGVSGKTRAESGRAGPGGAGRGRIGAESGRDGEGGYPCSAIFPPCPRATPCSLVRIGWWTRSRQSRPPRRFVLWRASSFRREGPPPSPKEPLRSKIILQIQDKKSCLVPIFPLFFYYWSKRSKKSKINENYMRTGAHAPPYVRPHITRPRASRAHAYKNLGEYMDFWDFLDRNHVFTGLFE